MRMSLATTIRTATHFIGEPLHVMVAAGHGRSYGKSTRVLGRQLTGITQCGLWQALEDQSPLPAHALVTDIGNDLLFGVAPQQIAEWVEQCTDRLLAQDAQVIMTRLPLANFNSLSTTRFKIFRSLLFPRSRQSLTELRYLASELDDRVTELSRSRPITLVDQSPDWYGFDPIHPRFRHWPTVQQTLLASWRVTDVSKPDSNRWRDHVRAWRLRGEERLVFGRMRRSAQPCARLPDGTIVALH